MPKSKPKKTTARPRFKETITSVPLDETTRQRYLNYALSVITSRALPDVRDGLKPVQRTHSLLDVPQPSTDARSTTDQKRQGGGIGHR